MKGQDFLPLAARSAPPLGHQNQSRASEAPAGGIPRPIARAHAGPPRRSEGQGSTAAAHSHAQPQPSMASTARRAP